MTNEELAYLAGIVDGEGCISHAGEGALQLIVVTTNPALGDWLKSRAGGRTNLRRRLSSPLSKRRVIAWQISGAPLVDLARSLAPFIVVKAEQIRLVIAADGLVGRYPKRVRVTSAIRKRRLAIVQAVAIANRGGDQHVAA